MSATAIAAGTVAAGALQSGGGIIGSILGRKTAKENLALQREQFDYQRNLQQQMFEREDNQWQRAYQDALAAGMNPAALSSGNEAGEVVPTEVPQEDASWTKQLGQGLSDLSRMVPNMNQMYSTLSQMQVAEAQSGYYQAMANKANVEAARIGAGENFWDKEWQAKIENMVTGSGKNRSEVLKNISLSGYFDQMTAHTKKIVDNFDNAFELEKTLKTAQAALASAQGSWYDADRKDIEVYSRVMHELGISSRMPVVLQEASLYTMRYIINHVPEGRNWREYINECIENGSFQNLLTEQTFSFLTREHTWDLMGSMFSGFAGDLTGQVMDFFNPVKHAKNAIGGLFANKGRGSSSGGIHLPTQGYNIDIPFNMEGMKIR